MKKKNAAQWITRTAVVLAIALVSQMLRMIWPGVPTLVIGSLVNAALIVATGMIGLSSGLVIAVLTPIVALLQGQLPHILLVPGVILGNALYVMIFYWLSQLKIGGKRQMPGKTGMWAGMAVGAAVKFAALYLIVVKFLLPLVISAKTVELSAKLAEDQVAANTAKISAAISAAFSWPQLFTALIGGSVALIILPVLKKAASPRR